MTLKEKEVVKTSEVIAVGKEAYRYLKNLSREQRGCKPLNDEQFEKFWRKLHKTKDGLKEIDNNSLGGGDFTYNGKWWAWSVEIIRIMLKDAGYTWQELGTRETHCVNVYF